MVRQKRHVRRSKRGRLFRAGRGFRKRKKFSSLEVDVNKYINQTDHFIIPKQDLYTPKGRLAIKERTMLPYKEGQGILERIKKEKLLPYGKIRKYLPLVPTKKYYDQGE